MLKIPREALHIVWVSNFYDVPLEGLCRVDGKLMRFTMPTGLYSGRDRLPRYHVFELSRREKVSWLLKKWAFELCVGTHCSWNGNKRNHYWSLRKPEWFWHRLFLLYYHLRKVGVTK